MCKAPSRTIKVKIENFGGKQSPLFSGFCNDNRQRHNIQPKSENIQKMDKESKNNSSL